MNRLRSPSKQETFRTIPTKKPGRDGIALEGIAPPSAAAEPEDWEASHINVIVHLMIIALGLIFLGIAGLLLP
jgi:hypothetical protein